ncbi:unnamed protein product (macronuclear) [Paramecium tetraurelia]|uniref:Cyclic nucleotide-binding domain-containing protein n=1 Tax=Paramecium tetraurelia TaxID=5888 RepID=A0CJ04_PARTE|nr:uncharacterized protein GSPATT00007906001 [Paramecium tetraurelia]CAK70771.1 unnamed protein product [Paramecium tetraurelia]|eukprot:XP_001438168.1 hypothetical protein (macronuclear) [Paramecium tetraurelia strain d4-2]
MINRSPTMKTYNKQNQSQDPLLIMTPPSSLREISCSFRGNLNRYVTIQSRRNKQEQQEDQQHSRQYRMHLQRMYQETFIKQLLDKTKPTSKMNNYQKQVLDDLQFGQDTQIDDIDSSCYKFMFNYFNNYPIIQPQSNLKICSDIIFIINTLIILIWLPLKYSFELDQILQILNYNNYEIIEYLLIVMLAFEIILQFNQAYIFKGKVINQRYHIIYNYLKQDMIKDLICLVSLIVLLLQTFEAGELNLVLLCAFGLLQGSKLLKVVNNTLEYYNIQQNNLIPLVINVIGVIYLIHLVSCIQYTLIKEVNNANSLENVIQQYVQCFNWASVYLTSAGFSNIESNNNEQLIFSSVISIVSILIDGFISIKIGLFLYNHSQRIKHNQYINMMTNFMNLNSINLNLQHRIRSYLQYIYKQEQQMNDEDITQIMVKLSHQLRSELKHQLQANILEQCKMISQNFSLKLRKQLVYYMEELKTVPEQRILTLNEQDDSSIYFINKGEVNVIFEQTNNMNEKYPRNHIKTLQKGEYFGFLGFITGSVRTATIISKGFCQLYKIQRNHFVNLLEQFPDDKEKFYMIKDKVQFQQDLSMIDARCYSCKSTSHLVNQCPFLHFEPDKDRVVKQQLYPIQQEREEIQRKSKYINALLQQAVIQDLAKELMKDLEHVEESENISESQSQDIQTRTIKSTSNVQTRSLSKSFSQYSNQLSKFSHRPSQTLTVAQSQNYQSLMSQEEIGKFEQELIKKMPLHRRSQQKETAGFGARFESQMHNPIQDHDEDIPNIDMMDDEVQVFQQESHKPSQQLYYSDKSPRIHRRIQQKVKFDQNLLGIKNRRSSLIYENYIQQLYEEEHYQIEFPILTQPSVGDFDKICEFREYYPEYNISRVMRFLHRVTQTYRRQPTNSLYSFLFIAIQKGHAMKDKLHHFHSRSNIKPSNNRRIYKKGKIKTVIF